MRRSVWEFSLAIIHVLLLEFSFSLVLSSSLILFYGPELQNLTQF